MMRNDSVTFIFGLIVVAIVVLNIFGKGLDNPEQLLREIVMVLVGAFGNEALHNMRKDKSNAARIGNSDSGGEDS